jgi:hypothetical protein
MRSIALAVTLVALSSCTVRYVRPPAAPPRSGTALDPPRLPTGDEGTVTLNADTPSRVEVVTQRMQVDPSQNPWGAQQQGWSPGPLSGQLSVRPLCETPCAINLPRGHHELLFSDLDLSTGRTSIARVRVGERPTIAVHALGRQTNSIGGIIGAILLGGFGLSAAALGGMLMAFGTDESGNDLRPAGGAVLGVGVAMGIGAWVLGELSRPTMQPGATTQWNP